MGTVVVPVQFDGALVVAVVGRAGDLDRIEVVDVGALVDGGLDRRTLNGSGE